MFQIRLKKLREDAGFTQAALSKKLGVSQGTIGNWESGTREPNLDTLQQIANYFHVSTDYLLGKTDIPGPGYSDPSQLKVVMNIRRLLEQQKKTPSKLDSALKLPLGTTEQWLLNQGDKSYMNHLPQIAAFFQVSTDYLLTNVQVVNTGEDLPDIYLRLAQGAKQMDLSERDIKTLLDIARTLKERDEQHDQ